MDSLMEKVFDEVNFLDILRPMECVERLGGRVSLRSVGKLRGNTGSRDCKYTGHETGRHRSLCQSDK